jgi:uncharacterized protein YlzI (FlbEa/FlbD family)
MSLDYSIPLSSTVPQYPLKVQDNPKFIEITNQGKKTLVNIGTIKYIEAGKITTMNGVEFTIDDKYEEIYDKLSDCGNIIM